MRRVWQICSTCAGEGQHSRDLGAFSTEDFEQTFSFEEQEQYFAGGYDRRCETCDGTGKVQVAEGNSVHFDGYDADGDYCHCARCVGQAERDEASERYTRWRESGGQS